MKRSWWSRFKQSHAHTQANIVCTIFIMFATIGYAIIAGFQLHEIKRTNDLTQQALQGSGQSLTQTLAEMGAQVDATNLLYGQAQLQTAQAKRQADAAKSADITAKAALQMEERAWVASSIKVTGPLHFKEDGVFLPIEISLTNLGHSPAQDVTTWVQLIPGYPPSQKQIVSDCAVLKPPASHSHNAAILMFPGALHSQREPVALNQPQLAEAIKKSPGGKLSFYLITCVDYTIFDSQIHHQTRALFGLAWTMEGGYLNGLFDPAEEYKAVSLLPLYNDSAD